VAVFGHLAQRVVDARLDTSRIVGRQAQRLGNLVGRLEADAVDVLHQLIGCGLDDRQRLIAILLVDLDRQMGGDAVAVEEDHHILDGPLLFPGLDDVVDALAADAQHFAQPLRVLVDDIQRFRAETVDDALGHDLAHAAHHAGAEIALDPLDRCRNRLLAQLHLELAAVFCVIKPLPGQLQPLARVDLRQIADDSSQRLAVGIGQQAARVRPQPQNGVAVLLVVIGDALHGAADFHEIAHKRDFTSLERI